MIKLKLLCVLLFIAHTSFANENTSSSISGQAISGVKGDINIYNNYNNSKPNISDQSHSSNNYMKKKVMIRYYNDIEIKLNSCFQLADLIKCKFTIKNTDIQDKLVTLHAASSIIDTEGNQYYAWNSPIKFGNLSSDHPRKLLVQNISVKAEVKFNKVASNGVEIPLLKLGIGGKIGRSFIEFRKIVLNREYNN